MFDHFALFWGVCNQWQTQVNLDSPSHPRGTVVCCDALVHIVSCTDGVVSVAARGNGTVALSLPNSLFSLSSESMDYCYKLGNIKSPEKHASCLIGQLIRDCLSLFLQGFSGFCIMAWSFIGNWLDRLAASLVCRRIFGSCLALRLFSRKKHTQT